MASFFFTLAVLLLMILPAVFARCTHSSDCASGNPGVISMCAHRHGICLSLPHPSARQEDEDDDEGRPINPDLVPTTLERLVNDTNAIDFPLAEKIETIETIKKVYDGINPHKFLHENLLGIDFPAALDAIEFSEKTTNVEFFDKMVKTFQLMDDKHSVYLLPFPFNSSAATLGVFPKIFYDTNSKQPMKRRYVITDALEGFIPNGTSFGIGSEILTFNGDPIDDVIIALGNDSFGSNDAAQIDTAVGLLTVRILVGEPIPFEPYAEFGYVNLDGEKGTVKMEWLFFQLRRQEMADAMMRQVTPVGSGPRLKPKKKSAVGLSTLNSNVRVAQEDRTLVEIDPDFEDSFAAEILSTKNGLIGHFVLPDFASELTPALIAELTRVLKLMPKNGLIMDLRGNRGGSPDYVKIVVELLTGRSPPQSPTVIRSSKLMNDAFDGVLEDAASEEELSAYRGAVETAFKLGEPFSGPTVGLYSSEFVNSPEDRAYFGPIVTVVDGLCYSAGDLFAALQTDLGYSLLVGVSDNVGAGGASTLSYSDLQEIFPTVLKPITGQFSTAFSRAFRSGKKEGAIYENFGVKPDIRYYSTLDDALKSDCDLYEFLSDKLQELNGEDGIEAVESPEEEIVGEGEGVEPSPEEIM